MAAVLAVLAGTCLKTAAQPAGSTLPPNAYSLYMSDYGPGGMFTASVNDTVVHPPNTNECFTPDRHYYLGIRMWLNGRIESRPAAFLPRLLDPIQCDDIEPHTYNATFQLINQGLEALPGIYYYSWFPYDDCILRLSGYGPDYLLPYHFSVWPDFGALQHYPTKMNEGDPVSVTATGIRAGTYYLDAILKRNNTYSVQRVSNYFTTSGGSLTLQSFPLDTSAVRENSRVHLVVNRLGTKMTSGHSLRGLIVGSDFVVRFAESKEFCADSTFIAGYEWVPPGTYQVALVDSVTAGTVLGTLSDPVTLNVGGQLQINSYPLQASFFPGGVLPARFTYRILKDGVIYDEFVEKYARISVCTGTPQSTAGQTLSFGGTNEVLVVADNPSLVLNQFTVETWMRRNRNTTFADFICSKAGTENMELQLRDSGRIRFIPAPGVYLDCPVNTLPASLSAWTHVAATYNPAIGAARLFVNGVEVPLTNNGTAPLTTPIGRNNGQFVIGARNGNGFLPFAGRLEEFRLWNRALAAWEIRARMNCEIPSSATNLVLNLHFNQGVAGEDNSGDPASRTAVDASGYNNHASLRNFTLSYVFSNWMGAGPVVSGSSCPAAAAPVAEALDFDGTNDFVNIPSRPALSPTRFTIESWVRWSRTTSLADFICSKGGVENMELHLSAGNSIRFIPAPGVYLDAPPNTITQNVWTHIACAYDPTIGVARMYVNGVEVTLTNNGTAPLTTLPVANTGALVVGSRGASLPFAGRLNDFRLWNRVLTQPEIQARLHCRITRPDPNLLVNLHLAGTLDAVNTATDASGNGNHGDLSGFALSGTASNWVSGGAGTTSMPSALAAANAIQVRVVAGQATSFGTECSDVIATVTPSGSFPINSSTTGKVWIESAQPAQYVKRHYEITPATDAGAATGTVTLYFTQNEFDDFNAVNTLKLPRFPGDAPGIANLRIEKRSGVSSDGSGLPDTYPAGTPLTIDPADTDIVWNAAAARWEVSFAVAGFSGFFAKTMSGPLPVTLAGFAASLQGCRVELHWHTLFESNADRFAIQRSADGIRFETIGTTRATNSAAGSRYRYTDMQPAEGTNIYRLQMVDQDGSSKYSPVVSRSGCGMKAVRVYPNPAADFLTIDGLVVGDIIRISTVAGQEMDTKRVLRRTEQLAVGHLVPGVYLIAVISNRDGKTHFERFYKQ
ncbi:LamG-like jellyroll fold domain-containing protein [Flaviaesturariibacter amylovorans]|uniref:LamG-like jellyroll fold domain-containing protein n=1 Tax=Flaviaesturariibacter amylovorans TaxID=1084520 RepID=UPI0031EC8245